MAVENSERPSADRGYAEDVFLRAWIEKRVRDDTDQYLKKLRSIAAFFILLISAILAAFGYNLTEMRKELAESVKRATKDAEQAKATVSAAQLLVAQGSEVSKSAFEHVRNTIALMDTNVSQSSSSVNALATALSSVRDQQEVIKKTQAHLDEQARGFKKQQEAITKVFEARRKEIDEIGQASLKKTRQTEKRVKETADSVDKTRSGIEKIQKIYSDLLERRQVEYAFLRSYDSRIIDLYSFVRHDQQVRHFKVKLSTEGIKDRIGLVVDVLDDGSGRPGAKRTYEQLRQSVAPIPIDGTPFVFRVEFVYHAKLAFDFVVVKIEAAEQAA